jgi:hypothetical protein
MSTVRHKPFRDLQIVDDFCPRTADLRAHFDDRFADPRSTAEGRFVWDFWHVPGQYTALRTPAWRYFPADLYRPLHEALVQWGRKTLGCHDISPPWLSCYIDGCGQELHGDLPHGPFAFVLSLTPWQQRQFTGGETLLLRDEVLDYWRDFASTRALEQGEIVRAIAPKFGRLTVFDPRLPHGVRPVRGTMDPRHGRLVLHGWFVQPRPFVQGPVTTDELAGQLEALDEVVAAHLAGGLDVAGLLSVRLDVATTGHVQAVTVLADTLRAPAEQTAERQRLRRAVVKQAGQLLFAPHRRTSQVTIPVVFSR